MLIPTIGGNVGQPFYIAACFTSMEWGNLPGVENTDYLIHTTGDIDEVCKRRFNSIRLSFMHERIQPTLNTAFSDAVGNYWTKLQAFVAYANSKGLTVILNPHNFAEYYRSDLGSNYVVGSAQYPISAFADFWGRLAAVYRNNSKLIMCLTNEPKDNINGNTWVTAMNAALVEIRKNGFTGVVHCPTTGYTGSLNFFSAYNLIGTAPNVALLNLVDPGNNINIEIHSYGNDNGSGGAIDIPTATEFKTRWIPIVAWARANKRKIFVGETAANTSGTNASAAMQDQLQYIYANRDVFTGIGWWAQGAYTRLGVVLTPTYTLWDTASNTDTNRLDFLKPYLGI